MQLQLEAPRLSISSLILLPVGPTPQLQQVVQGHLRVSWGSPREWRPPSVDHISDPAQDLTLFRVVFLVLGATKERTVWPDVALLEGNNIC